MRPTSEIAGMVVERLDHPPTFGNERECIRELSILNRFEWEGPAL